MREINKIADALFEKIRDRFEDVSLGDENAKATNDPESARFFNFDYAVDGENYGNITMSLIDEKSLKVYYSKNITEKLSQEDKQKWYAFLRELREFARRNLLSFEPRDITRGTLKYRDIHQQSRADGTFGTDEVVSESRMYGTVNRSYESFGPVRIKLKHNKPIVDEAPGARSRNIDAIFLENDQGERFRLPFTNLSGARAMARHVSAGGVPNDELGCHITNIVKEMTALRPFVFGMRNRTFEDVTTNDMVESAFEYHGLLKNTLKKLRGRRGYTEFKDNFKPALNETDVDVESLKEKFVKRIFDDRLAEALPIVHRAYEMKQANTNPYLQAFEGWATKISEGVWAVPDSDEAQNKLKDLLAEPLEVGVDAANATAALSDIIGDDELYDDLAELAEQDPASDARPLIQHWLRDNGYSNLAGEDQVEPEKNMHGSAQGGVDGTVNESHDSYEAVQAAIIRRIIHQHKDALAKYGPEAIMNAAADEAAFVGDVEEIGSSDVSGWVRSVIQALESGQHGDASSDVLESDATYDEDEDDYDEEDQEDQSFYVVLADEDGEVFVGSISKEDGRWRERRVSGKAPYGWSGSNYMSYLKPNDIMRWIRKDYERNYVIKGPFFDEESLHAATSWLQESQSKPRNFVAKNAPRTGAGAHKNKKKADRQGDVKHKKSAELEQQLSEDVSTDAVSVIVKEVIKLIGEGHTEVSPDVVTAKISAALGQPFMLKDLVAANNSSSELQHYIDSINPSKIKFSTDILTVKNQDPARAKEKAQNGVASMAARAANRPGLSEGSTMGHSVGFMTMPDLKPGDKAHHGMLGPVTVVRHDGPRVVVRDQTRQLYRMSPHKLQPAEDTTEDRKPSLKNPQDNPCWSGYHPVGTKKKNGRTVPNCVPKESINEETTADKISAALTAKGVTYSRDREEEIINMIGDEMKQQGMSGKNIRHLMSYDQDFIPDVLAGLARDVTEAAPNLRLVRTAYELVDRFYSEFGIDRFKQNLKVTGPVRGRVWTRGDGSRYRDPGMIQDLIDSQPSQVNDFWEWLQGQPGVRPLGQISGEFASSDYNDAVSYNNKMYFSHTGRSITFGSKKRISNPTSVWKRRDTPTAEQGVTEGEHDSRKPFGVRYKVFAGREGRVSTKEYWTTSEEKLQKAVAKIQALDNFYGIDGYSYPKEQGVAEGSFGSGYGSVFTLYVNTGEKSTTKTKTKKFKREDDAVYWAEDYADQHEMFPNLKMEIQDENGNVVWELEESQGVAEAAKWRSNPGAYDVDDEGWKTPRNPNSPKFGYDPLQRRADTANDAKTPRGKKTALKTSLKMAKGNKGVSGKTALVFPATVAGNKGVAEGSTSKEKQKTPYRDINSSEYKAAVEKQKEKMAKDNAAEPGKKLLGKIEKKGVAEGSEIKIPTADGITMQDIRLMAGEGKLSQKTIRQAIAVIRKQRQPRQSVTEDHDQSIFNRYVLPALEKTLGQDSAFDRLNQRAEDAIGKYVIPALERAMGEGSTFDELNQKAEDLIGKYVIPFLRKIMGEESERVAEARRPTDFATITIENPDDTGDIDLEVGYHTEGDYYPATRLEPASYPEIIIDSVRRTDTGAEILSILDKDTYEYILNQLYDRQEQYEGVNEISDKTKASYQKQAQKQVQDLMPHARTGEYRDMAKNIINKRQQGLARLGTVAENMLADYARNLDSISEGRDGRHNLRESTGIDAKAQQLYLHIDQAAAAIDQGMFGPAVELLDIIDGQQQALLANEFRNASQHIHELLQEIIQNVDLLADGHEHGLEPGLIDNLEQIAVEIEDLVGRLPEESEEEGGISMGDLNEQGVAEATGDTKFDTMMGNIVQKSQAREIPEEELRPTEYKGIRVQSAIYPHSDDALSPDYAPFGEMIIHKGTVNDVPWKVTHTPGELRFHTNLKRDQIMAVLDHLKANRFPPPETFMTPRGKMKMSLKDGSHKTGVTEDLESLESLIGQRVYVKSVGEMGTVSDVSMAHRNSLIVDLDNGDLEIAHFTDLSQERPGMMRRMMDKIKSSVAATAPLKESTEANNSDADVAELRRLAGLK